MTPSSLLRLVLLAALWGGSFLFMRMVAPVLGAVPTAFGRVAIGAGGLVVLLPLLATAMRFNGKLAATMALGAINSGLPFLMFSLAAQVLPAGYSAILNATTPLMGVVIGVAAFGERASWSRLGGVLVGLVGVFVLTRVGPLRADTAIVVGVLQCLLATGCYGVAGFLTKRWITQRGGLDSKVVALGSQLGAVALLLPFALWDIALQPIAWQAVDGRLWWALVALGLFCTSFAYILYFRLIADVGPMKALMVTFLIPPFGIFWGWLVLDEVVTGAHAVGGALIALALWVVLRSARQQAPGASSQPS